MYVICAIDTEQTKHEFHFFVETQFQKCSEREFIHNN